MIPKTLRKSESPPGEGRRLFKPDKRLGIVTIGLLAAAFVAPAPATELQPNPDFALVGPGLTVAEAGAGVQFLGAGTAFLDVEISGPVLRAALYWAGRDFACGDCDASVVPYRDQEIIFDGAALTGAVLDADPITNPVTGAHSVNITYYADVTATVAARGPGFQTFTFQDGDLSNNLSSLNGAGLLIVYQDPTDPAWYRLIVIDGVDYAYGPAQLQTQPETFLYQAVGYPRQAELLTFVGDAQVDREDILFVSDNAPTVNHYQGLDGEAWDTSVFVVDIPAGVGATTIQLVSPEDGVNPDSLLWSLAALRLPVEPPPGTGTPGYWKNHPDAWPVDEIVIGGATYTKEAAIAALGRPTAGDKRRTLFRSLTAATLNVLVGNDSTCIADTLDAAHDWYAVFGGSRVRANSPAWREAEPLHETLDAYNNGELCAASRDTLEGGSGGGDPLDSASTKERKKKKSGRNR